MPRYIDAIKLIKEFQALPCCRNGYSDEYDKARIFAMIDNQPTVEGCKEALEKQIPKKPIEVKNIYPPEQFECPVCGSCVGRHKTLRKINELLGETLTDCKVEFKYCCECGQRMDWGEETDNAE